MSGEAQRRLGELPATRERVSGGATADGVTWQLRALSRDIAAACAELEEVIAAAGERRRRLDALDGRAEAGA